MKEYTVIMLPPEGHPATFTEKQKVGVGTDDEGEIEVERPYMRHISLKAVNEDMARRVCERQAERIALQEVGGQYPDDPDAADAAAMEVTWRIDSITEAGAEAPAEEGSDDSK